MFPTSVRGPFPPHTIFESRSNRKKTLPIKYSKIGNNKIMSHRSFSYVAFRIEKKKEVLFQLPHRSTYTHLMHKKKHFFNVFEKHFVFSKWKNICSFGSVPVVIYSRCPGDFAYIVLELFGCVSTMVFWPAEGNMRLKGCCLLSLLVLCVFLMFFLH